MDLLSDSFVQLVQLLPVLELDIFTALPKLPDQPRVVICEIDIGDFAIVFATTYLPYNFLEELDHVKFESHSI